MILPVNPPKGTLIIGQTVTTAGTPGAPQAANQSFSAHYLDSLASAEQQASQATAAFTHGGGSATASIMAVNAEADLKTQEFALLVGKALQSYQSIMNMQV